MIVLSSFLLSLLFGSSIGSSNDLFIWQGFRHQWLHTDAGFDTPHRMGSIANILVTSNTSNPSAFQRFTPGVNGDFAHPETRYSHSIMSTASEYYSSSASIHWEDTIVTLPNGNNLASGGGFQYIPLPVGWSHAAAALSGFNVSMQCVEGAGAICNSNGVWPSKFAVNVAAVYLGSKSALNVSVALDRSWTPEHGGGKPLSTHIAYHVVVSFVAFSVSAPVPLKPEVVESHLRKEGDPDGAVVRVPLPTLRSPAKDFVAGLAGFSFELTETNGHPELGRYLEQYDFEIQTAGAVGAFLPAKYSVALRAPITVVDSNVVLSVTPVAVPVDSAGPSSAATGKICVTGPLFKCSLYHLPETTEAVVPLK